MTTPPGIWPPDQPKPVPFPSDPAEQRAEIRRRYRNVRVCAWMILGVAAAVTCACAAQSLVDSRNRLLVGMLAIVSYMMVRWIRWAYQEEKRQLTIIDNAEQVGRAGVSMMQDEQWPPPPTDLPKIETPD